MSKQQSLTKQQAQLIKGFKDTTMCSQKQAIQYLTRTKWNIQNAINSFFDDGAIPEKEDIKSTSQIEKLFQELSSPSEKNPVIRLMDEERFSEFNQRYFRFSQDNIVLGHILINIMETETSGYIEYSHFVKLFKHLNISDPKQLPKFATKLQLQIKNDKFLYKQLYTKVYKFYIIGNKELSLQYAIAEELWTMYLKPIMHLYNHFMGYIKQKNNKPTRVHRDLWAMVYEFAITVSDVSTVNESDGWPVFIDEFVEYCKSGGQ